MDSFDKDFLQNLIDIGSSYEELVLLHDDLLFCAFEILLTKVQDYAEYFIAKQLESEQIDEENIDVAYEKEKFYIYATIIREAIIYCLIQSSKNSEEYINYILKTDFMEVIEDFKEGEEFSLFIIKCYIKYVYGRHSKLLTDELIYKVFDEHPWLNDLFYNKGYNTLNDMARKVLLDMKKDMQDLGYSEEEIFTEFDKYFKSKEANLYLRRVFPDFVNERDIIYIKLIQFRLIISDAYLAIKMCALTEPDKESLSSSEIIERIIAKNDFEFFKELKKVHFFYSFFFIYNSRDFYRTRDLSLLKKNNSLYYIKRLNPIYFMD